ncbi:unnamed protein product [Trifolium pratense]|uniref:Uncharacterized protein n=1 Tax=Trifolium pratense TaxID=57577 RepID=A0ACB0KXJ8_TRIPR|nr:unnamed protein product [Trifolium pratense]
MSFLGSLSNSVAACRYTLSIPTPTLPTTFNFPFPASNTCLVNMLTTEVKKSKFQRVFHTIQTQIYGKEIRW